MLYLGGVQFARNTMFNLNGIFIGSIPAISIGCIDTVSSELITFSKQGFMF